MRFTLPPSTAACGYLQKVLVVDCLDSLSCDSQLVAKTKFDRRRQALGENMKSARRMQMLLLVSIVVVGVALYGMVGNAFQGQSPEWWTLPVLLVGLILTLWLKSKAKGWTVPQATLPTNLALIGVLLTCITAHDYFANYARALAALFTLLGLAGMAYGWGSEEREAKLGRDLAAQRTTIRNLNSQIANLKRGGQDRKSKPLLRRR